MLCQEREDVEKPRLTFIRCLKLPQVADMVERLKVVGILTPYAVQSGKIK